MRTYTCANGATDAKGKVQDIVLGYDNTSYYRKHSDTTNEALSDMKQPLTLDIRCTMQFRADM